MNEWYIRFLRMKYAVAGAVVFITAVIITPLLVELAFQERGYEAIGGEYAPLVFSVLIAVWIIQGFGELEDKYWRRQRKARRESRGTAYGKVQAVREEAERPGFNISRVRSGLCFEVEQDSLVFLTFPEAEGAENQNRSGVCSITFMKKERR